MKMSGRFGAVASEQRRARVMLPLLLVVLVAATAAAAYWRHMRPAALPPEIVGANGRLEAEQVEISAKLPGRLAEVRVEEGDLVRAGSIIAVLDGLELEAQLRGAEAQVRRGDQAAAEARAGVSRAQSELSLARKDHERAVTLFRDGYVSRERLDQQHARVETAEATLRATQAALNQAIAGGDAAAAEAQRLLHQLDDLVLRTPRSGRVQYRLAHPGEVIGAGARVVTILDIGDVYMTVYVPAAEAGRLAIGDEARLVLDPVPQYVIPAYVSFVAPEAQFTPKAVETAAEREKLMFRVKVRIPRELLQRYESQVKTGIRGMAYLRLRRDVSWPDRLAPKLPQ